MFKNYIIAILVLLTLITNGCVILKNNKKQSKETHILMETSKGSITLKLYNETPLHRDNFIKLVNEKFYNGITFHRVIKGFMAQAGDPKSRDKSFAGQLGQNSEGETIPAEIIPNLFHKKGALAAARMGDNVNPEKKSSGSQFYIVQGRKYDLNQLSQMENQINQKAPHYQHQQEQFTFSDTAKKVYQQIGGTPFLDNGYTVFGEVIQGIEVIDAICDVKTERGNKPSEPVTILSVTIMK
ncbi:MAG: peptidylprolyl isomerase [Crocinitomicaceae bacterium]|nr:peptidylprolyl isomerase [Crocinitomicaceae bacterium]|tara:strand:+ start:9033 stop:9752 length:720 start_codon:yes stop_codon:yes gene_type:complete